MLILPQAQALLDTIPAELLQHQEPSVQGQKLLAVATAGRAEMISTGQFIVVGFVFSVVVSCSPHPVCAKCFAEDCSVLSHAVS